MDSPQLSLLRNVMQEKGCALLEAYCQVEPPSFWQSSPSYKIILKKEKVFSGEVKQNISFTSGPPNLFCSYTGYIIPTIVFLFLSITLIRKTSFSKFKKGVLLAILSVISFFFIPCFFTGSIYLPSPWHWKSQYYLLYESVPSRSYIPLPVNTEVINYLQTNFNYISKLKPQPGAFGPSAYFFKPKISKNRKLGNF